MEADMERPERRLGILSERTLVPIGSLVILIAGIAWIVNISFQANAASKTVDTVVQRLNEISERLARIEGKLNIESGAKR